jgi:hypothetical protein
MQRIKAIALRHPMGDQETRRRRFRTTLVNVLWVPGISLIAAAFLVPIYYWMSSPQSPDTASGHVVLWAGRGGAHIYVTAAEQRFELALCICGMVLFLPGHLLRRRWKMLPDALVVPDYEKIRATYNNKNE